MWVQHCTMQAASQCRCGRDPEGKKSGWRSNGVSRPRINPSWSFVTYQRYPSILSTQLLSSSILQYDIPGSSIFLYISPKVSRPFWLLDRTRTKPSLSRDTFRARLALTLYFTFFKISLHAEYFITTSLYKILCNIYRRDLLCKCLK